MKWLKNLRTFFHDAFDVSNDPLKKEVLEKGIQDMSTSQNVDGGHFQMPVKQTLVKPASMATLLIGLLALSNCCGPWAQLPHNPDYKPQTAGNQQQ